MGRRSKKIHGDETGFSRFPRRTYIEYLKKTRLSKTFQGKKSSKRFDLEREAYNVLKDINI